MILGRRKLQQLIDKGLITYFCPECLGGAGYDLRADRIYSLESESYLGVSKRETPKVEEIKFEKYTLAPGEYVLVETFEKVNMPKNLAARVLNRSTLFRCGCSLFNAFVDPGYKGTLTFGLKNLGLHDFTIERHAKIAQIIFEEVEGETTAYNGRYQGGKVV